MSTGEYSKKNYIMHAEYDEHFNLLNDEELGRLIRDVNSYVKVGKIPKYSSQDRVLNMAFSFMKATIDIEREKYEKKCEINRQNGKLGGRPKNISKANGFEENQKKANGLFDNPIDIDMDINNVCNKEDTLLSVSNEQNNLCHLGSKFKTESCFYCMKKNLCKNEESADFKLQHGNETFEEWNEKRETKMNLIVEELKERGQPIPNDISVLENWLKD